MYMVLWMKCDLLSEFGMADLVCLFYLPLKTTGVCRPDLFDTRYLISVQ